MTTEVCINCATPVPAESRFCSKCGTPVPGQDAPTLTPQGREIFERLVRATEGHYEIVRELGRGGMAVVFLGSQKSLDREVAIKVLLPLLGYDPDLVQRFMREARTQGRLEHPYIISVYEVYSQGGLTFFSMPYISGRNLRSFLQEQPRPPIELVRRYLIQAAEALDYAHGRGVIHRDVKPDNILISQERNCVVLTDFGIAKAVSAATTLTTPGDLLGTPLYMSPEQGEGRQNLDGRADLYSLGLIGYEMLVGHPAYKANNLAELMYKHRFEDPPSLNELRPDTPVELRAALMRAIAKLPEKRFENMKAFIAALEGRDVETIRIEPGDLATESQGVESEPTLRIPTPEGSPGGPQAGEAAFAGSTDPTIATPSPHRQKVTEPQPLRSRTRLLVGLGAAVAAVAAVLWLVLGPGLPGTGDEGLALRSDPPASVEGSESGGTSEDSPEQPGDAGPPSAGEQGGGDDADGDDAAGDDATTGETRADQATVGAIPERNGDEEAGGAAADQVGKGGAGTESEVPPARDADRVRAVEARDRAEAAREAAVGAGASNLLAQRLGTLDERWVAAARELDTGQFSAAAAAFTGLVDEYAALESESRRIADGLRDASEIARSQADEGRNAAVAAGAEERASEELSRLDSDRRAAVQLLASGDYERASAQFRDLETAYRQLAARLEESEVAEKVQPADETPSPTEAVTRLIEGFRQAFEQEDKERLRSAIYRGNIPDGDERILDAVFDGADELNVALELESLRLEAQQARADITLNMQFLQARRRTPERKDLKLRLEFVSEGNTWQLKRLRIR